MDIRSILFIMLLFFNTTTFSQVQMFKNFSYYYTKIELNNQSYIDTLVFTFEFKRKYKKKKEEISRIKLSYGLINDTISY